MEEQPSNDWMEMRSVVAKGLRGQDRLRQWRRVCEPDVVSLVAEVDEDGSEVRVTLLFYDPTATEGVHHLRFDLLRRKSRWRLILPPELRYADINLERFEDLTRRGRTWDELEVRKRFRVLFEKKHPLRAAATLAEAGEQVLEALAGGTMAGMFQMLDRSKGISETEHRVKFAEAAKVWAQFRGGSGKPSLVEVLEREQAGVVVFSQVDSSKLNWVQLTPVHFMKGEGGWTIAPGVSDKGNFEAMPEELKADQKALNVSYLRGLKEFRREAAQPFLATLGVVTGRPAEGVDREEAVELVKDYRKTLAGENLLAVLDHCGLVDPEGGTLDGLRAISYEARGAKLAPDPDEILLVNQEGPWTAVSVRVSAPSLAEPNYPMYLVAMTDRGPRIVADADLRLATNKGRTLLNRKSLARLGQRLEAEQVELVDSLFRGHVEITEKHYEEWQKNTK